MKKNPKQKKTKKNMFFSLVWVFCASIGAINLPFESILEKGCGGFLKVMFGRRMSLSLNKLLALLTYSALGSIPKSKLPIIFALQEGLVNAYKVLSYKVLLYVPVELNQLNSFTNLLCINVLSTTFL
jgi:hypothetical protein